LYLVVNSITRVYLYKWQVDDWSAAAAAAVWHHNLWSLQVNIM